MKILLVDDDIDLLDVTAYALRREGFNVIVATDGMQALQRCQASQPDVMVLDVGLPKLSGFDVCRAVQQTNSTAVILLTAHGDEEHVVEGFRVGADDYVTKPFSPRQLALRIRAVGRRMATKGNPEPARELRAGDLLLDIEAHSVHRDQRATQLTPLEFRLLHILASNDGRVVASERLVEYAWGYDQGEVSLLKTHVCHIRQKLRAKLGSEAIITAVPSVGYRFTGAAAS